MQHDVANSTALQTRQAIRIWKIPQRASNICGQSWSIAAPTVHDRMRVVDSVVVIPCLIPRRKVLIQVSHGQLNDGLLVSMSGKPLIDGRNSITCRNAGYW